MQILELKIRNVRGVSLDLAPDGHTILIWGANGTGKSAVVDAIDFLLTGDIERLRGRRGVSLREHGKHIKVRPEDAFVEAKVRLPGIASAIPLRRTFSAPATLDAPPGVRAALVPFLHTAAQRPHILTRANILRFISAAPHDRATLVQAILSLDRVEELRRVLTTAANSEKANLDRARSARLTAEGALQTTLSLETWADPAALAVVNRLRTSLSGATVTALADAKRDLSPPSAARVSGAANPVHADVARAGSSLTVPLQSQLDDWDNVVLPLLATLNQDSASLRAARQVELIELGVSMLDDSGMCPLCDTGWNAEALRAHLEVKLESGRQTAPTWKKAREVTDALLQWVGDQPETLDRIISAGKQSEGGVDPLALRSYKENLDDLKKALADPLGRYASLRATGGTLSQQLGLADARDVLRPLFSETRPAVSANPAQTAWDTLTRAEENIKALSKAAEQEARARRSARRVEAASEAFVVARDQVLSDLYESVKGRFVELYKRLHAPDEQGFEADLEPGGAGLKLAVDFHGTGKVAPFALHSEGHKDSMGICLFLALREQVQGARMGFCMLDDVVMSADVGHRAGMARLLAELKATTQFIITTHDQVWVKQLQMAGCVAGPDTTQLVGWSLDGGTVPSNAPDFLGEVANDLARGNVRAAAAALRHGLEAYFHFVADALGAEVPYSLRGQYDHGQMFNACCGKQKKLLGKAKDVVQSSAQSGVLTGLNHFGRRRSAVLADARVREWAVNPNVHFNQWMTMTREEFAPVAEAFAAVCKLFQCPTCGSILYVVREGAAPSVLRCSCGATDWNLKTRSG